MTSSTMDVELACPATPARWQPIEGPSVDDRAELNRRPHRDGSKGKFRIAEQCCAEPGAGRIAGRDRLANAGRLFTVFCRNIIC